MKLNPNYVKEMKYYKLLKFLTNVWRSLAKIGSCANNPKTHSLTHELCDMLRRLVGTTAPGDHDCSIQE
ncbi:hypothetical protein TNCV_1307651 [Trichonephila clavipes]|nr:hypothetical protein TNCV_1307651 [Trichonephila clavipes]